MKYKNLLKFFSLFVLSLFLSETSIVLGEPMLDPSILNRNESDEKIVYLTFDDGPSVNTEKILDILKENDVHATFFIISPYIEPHNKIVERAFNEGNAVGNHTHDHEFKYIYVSEDAFWKNFNMQQDFIKTITGEDCTIFRFPGGSANTLVRNAHGSEFTKNIIVQLNNKGIHCYDWNVDSGDAKGNNIPSSVILQNIQKELVDKNGCKKNPAVVLMHDCMTKTTTVEALPSIIKYFKDEGYTFDTLK